MAIFGSQFYHDTLRRYIATFGNMFNDLTISRISKTGQVIQTLEVPISYSAKEKWLSRFTADPNLTKPVAIQLPAISFEMTSLSYDATRRLPSTIVNVRQSATDKNSVSYQYTPVPYNMDFSLYMYVRNADDGAQLLEQILPFFGPEWTNTIYLIPEMGIKMDVPTILNNVSLEDTYQGSFEDRRAIVWTLNFVMKGYFYGPVRHSGIIKRTKTDINIVDASGLIANGVYGFDVSQISDMDIEVSSTSNRIIITPGLLANGSPTSNGAASIPVSQITANSNYGIVANTFFFSDGRKYDPATGSDYYPQ